MDFEGIDTSYNVSYSPAQYTRLLELIEDQGGEHTDELCHARAYQFVDGLGLKTMTMPGCGNYSIFKIPFEVALDRTNAAILETVRLCAVCDGLALMPRFREALSA